MPAVSLGIAGCNEPSEPAADAAAAPSSAAPGLRFQRSGVSTDLLCALAGSISTALPDGFASAPAACECGFATPACKVVGSADRRRSLLLEPGHESAGDVAIPAGAMLRFSAAVLGTFACTLDLEVGVVDATSGERREWRRPIPKSDDWIDAEIDLRDLGGRTARVEIAVHRIALSPRPPDHLQSAGLVVHMNHRRHSVSAARPVEARTRL